jgi:hypothetical protein
MSCISSSANSHIAIAAASSQMEEESTTASEAQPELLNEHFKTENETKEEEENKTNLNSLGCSLGDRLATATPTEREIVEQILLNSRLDRQREPRDNGYVMGDAAEIRIVHNPDLERDFK